MSDQKSKENDLTPSSTDTIHLQRCHMRNNRLIWIAANIDPSGDDYQTTVTQLQNVVGDVTIFTDTEECIAFLTEITDMKVLLLTDDILGQQVLFRIHDSPQLETIYILRATQYQDEEWTQRWPKIQGVHTEIEPICKKVQSTVRQYNDNSIAMSFIPAGQVTHGDTVNELEPSFMYTQIFKEILFQIKHDAQAVQGLVTYWCELFINSESQLKMIDEFERGYRPEESIWWYTREIFTYEILNKSLRCLEGDVIIHMRVFIHDLHRQIEKLHREQVNSYHGTSFTVYRGQGLLNSDFEKLQKSKGGLISFNNFLSTSKDRDVSFVYAESNSTATTVGILFQMSIDPSINSTAYANIQNIGHFKTEEEILFSMHSVFRIGEIIKLDESNRFYQVNLKLTADDDDQLRILTNRIQEEVAGSTGWDRMVKLLLNIGQSKKAEKLYKVLLKQVSDEESRAHYYSQLGYVKDDQGDYKEAIRYYEQGLEIKRKTLPPNDSSLAISFNNIGAAYRNMGQHSIALSFHQKALEIRENVLLPDHPDIAQSRNNIGAIYQHMGDYSNAFLFYNEALAIREKVLPSNHPDVAQSYNNIGTTYDEIADYPKALLSYQKALAIWEKTLPANHHILATSYNNIGEVYRNMEKYLEGLSYHEKALNIRETILPSHHPDMAQTHNNMGVLYNLLADFSEALFHLGMAREICENTRPPNYSSLSSIHNNIGQVHQDIEEYPEALWFLEKALEFLKKSDSPNRQYLAFLYNNIGLVYINIDKYDEALSYLNQALVILQEFFSANHPRVESVQETIGLLQTIVHHE